MYQALLIARCIVVKGKDEQNTITTVMPTIIEVRVGVTGIIITTMGKVAPGAIEVEGHIEGLNLVIVMDQILVESLDIEIAGNCHLLDL